MTTQRRSARAPLRPTDGTKEWPTELADPDAAAWTSERKLAKWLDDHEVPPPRMQQEHSAAHHRRKIAIDAWALAHHPSDKWPGILDHHWMNTSGLRAVQQAATRAKRL